MASIELTQQEAAFLIQVLDQVTVPGLDNKMVVVRIMAKLIEVVSPQPPGQPVEEEEGGRTSTT